MTRRAESKAAGKTLRVLVADSTLLTGGLIADALRRDRELSITNATDSVIAAASTLDPHVTILSALEGIPGKGFDVLAELRAAVPQTRVVMLLDFAQRQMVWKPFARGREECFVAATRCRC
jgi:DNA-binding NarL/FixJ family response regulator